AGALRGRAYARCEGGGAPSPAGSRLAAFDGPADLSGRAALLGQLDGAALPGPAARATVYRERALRLLASPDVRRLFDLSKEPPALRARYGRHRLGPTT